MKNKLFSIIKVVFFLGLGILIIWLVAKNLTEEQKQQVYQSLKGADYTWVVLSIAIGIISNISRAVRWKMLLKPLGHSPRLSNTFFAVMIGYLANLAVPRLGEISRCGVLTRYEKIPFNQSFGTVITERIIDVLVLLLIFIITFFLESEKIYHYTIQTIVTPLKNKISGNHSFVYGGCVILIAIVVVVLIARKKTESNSLLSKIKTLLLGFWEGIKSIKNIENPALFIAHSLFIWLMYYFSVYVCFYCFEDTSKLSASAALVLLAFGSIAAIITPGGIGAYPVIAAEVLSLYDIPLPIGFAFGWVVWLSQEILLIILGLASLVLTPILNKKDSL